MTNTEVAEATRWWAQFPPPAGPIDYSKSKAFENVALYTPALSEAFISTLNKPNTNLGGGFSNVDLQFTNPNSKLFFYPWVLYSAGQAAATKSKASSVNWLTDRVTRDPRVVVLGDSGGYQVQQGTIEFAPDTTERMLRWLERVAEQSMILDFPTGGIARGSLTPHIERLRKEGHDIDGDAEAHGFSVDYSRFVREAINGRLLETGTPDSLGVWSHGFGAFGTVDGDGNAAGLDRQTGGLFVGADATLADGWRVGLLGGYGIGNYDVADRGSSASVESYNAAIYTGFTAGGFGFRLGADYAVHSIDTDRTIAFTGFSDQDLAAYTSQTGQVFGEVGYKLEVGTASFEPFAALAHVTQSTDGFSETGGDSALTAEADTVAATFATLGFRAATEIDLGEATATLSGSLGWRHAFGDAAPTSTMSFAGGEQFSIAGVPLATDAAVVDLGLDLAVSETATLGASYSGVISAAGYDYGAKAHLGWQF